MSDELAAKDFTKAEAVEITKMIRVNMLDSRQLLLSAYERNAWKALHYSNFEEYVQAEFGIDWKPEYLRKMLMWGRVEREVVLHVEQTGEDPKSIPYHHAQELARLPEGHRKRAYDDTWVLYDSRSTAGSPNGFLSNLKHVVNCKRTELGLPTTGNSMAPAIEPPAEPKPAQVALNFKPETVKAAKAEPAQLIPAPPPYVAPVVEEEDPEDYNAAAILAEPETLDLSGAIEGETFIVTATAAGLEIDEDDEDAIEDMSEADQYEEEIADLKKQLAALTRDDPSATPGAVCVQFTEDTYARLKPMLDVFRAYMKSPEITEGELIADIVFAHYQIRKERLKRFEV